MTTSPENQSPMPTAPRVSRLLALLCPPLAVAGPIVVGAAALVGGGCSLSDGGAAESIKPAQLFKDDITKDEAWRAKVKRDSFPEAGPDGL